MRITAKGQVTIPAEIRQALSIKPKDKVAFQLQDGTIKLVPVGSPLEASYQAVPALTRPRSDKQMTQIAAEEHAQQVAKEGL